MGGFQLCDVIGSMPGLYNQIMPTLLRGGHFQNLLKNGFGLLVGDRQVKVQAMVRILGTSFNSSGGNICRFNYF